jgi:hypothetical protein
MSWGWVDLAETEGRLWLKSYARVQRGAGRPFICLVSRSRVRIPGRPRAACQAAASTAGSSSLPLHRRPHASYTK